MEPVLVKVHSHSDAISQLCWFPPLINTIIIIIFKFIFAVLVVDPCRREGDLGEGKVRWLEARNHETDTIVKGWKDFITYFTDYNQFKFKFFDRCFCLIRNSFWTSFCLFLRTSVRGFIRCFVRSPCHMLSSVYITEIQSWSSSHNKSIFLIAVCCPSKFILR